MAQRSWLAVDVKCVVLAGGLGTRMSRFTKSIPKALIPVAGRPFLLWQLENLYTNGVTEVILSTGYLSGQIEEVVRDFHLPKMKITCVDDGPSLLGTAGCLRRLVDLGVISNTFLVTYGDSYLTVDHRKVFQTFRESEFEALMTVCSNKGGYEIGNASILGEEITTYKKGAPEMSLEWIDYGLSVLSADSISCRIPASESHDLATYFEKLAPEHRLQGFEVADRYFEVGSELGLQSMESFLKKGDLG